MSTSKTGIKKTFSPITVDSVEVSPYTKGGVEIAQAQVRQEVQTEYPSARVGNSMSDSLFSNDAFNFQPGQSYTSTRVTWLMTPVGTTTEQVEGLLAQFPNARIWAKYSNKVEDVMTEEQHAAVASGQQDLAFFQDKLRIRDANGQELDGYDEEGKAQYRSNGFSKVAKEDEDLRTFKGVNSTTNTTAQAVPQVATVGGDDQDALGG